MRKDLLRSVLWYCLKLLGDSMPPVLKTHNISVKVLLSCMVKGTDQA